MAKDKAVRKPGKSRYIAALIVNVILIYVFNNLLKWGVPFLTSDYSGVLWAIDLSLGATVIANILFLMFDPGWFHHFVQIILNVIALFTTFIIFSVFPFTFAEEPWAFWVKVALIVVIVGIAIGTIVEFFRLILRRD